MQPVLGLSERNRCVTRTTQSNGNGIETHTAATDSQAEQVQQHQQIEREKERASSIVRALRCVCLSSGILSKRSPSHCHHTHINKRSTACYCFRFVFVIYFLTLIVFDSFASTHTKSVFISTIAIISQVYLL